MNRRYILTTTAVLAALVILLPGSDSHAAKGQWGLQLGYLGSYESNIYHSYMDTGRTAALLNMMEAKASWYSRVSRSFRHELTGYILLDYYPSYTNRNRSAFGVRWEPVLRYDRKGRFIGNVELSRRNRDLIDDSGQQLARTFQKWVADFELTHRYDVGRWRFEQTIGWVNYNYDEVTGLRSYDYSGFIAAVRFRWDISWRWRATVIAATDKRNYDERRTYTIAFGATAGRPSEIREFRENSIEGELQYRLARGRRVWASVEYARRTENFENFYGYSFWQYRLGGSLRLSPRFKALVIARFKAKEYPNYWTRSIGANNRVSVDYTDFKLETTYRLSDLVEHTVFLRYYNKVSNHPFFDYDDITIGSGFRLRY